MQASKFRPLFVPTTVNNRLIWTATTTVAVDNVDTTPKKGTLKSWKTIPGPRSLPIFGSMHHYFPGGIFHKTDGWKMAQNLYDTYGPIVRLDDVIGRDPQIFIYDADSAAEILRAENWAPTRPGHESLKYYRKNIKKDAQRGRPTGLLTETGDEWKELRTALNPIMLKRTSNLYTQVLEEVAKDMVARIKSLRNENHTIKTKFDYEMNMWSTESIAVVLLGSRIGCLNHNLPEDYPAKELMKYANEIFFTLEKLEFKPTIWKIFSTRTYKRAIALYERHDTLTRDYISKAMKDFKMNPKSDSEKSVLEKLSEINEDYAFKIGTDLFIASIDSVSNAAIAVTYLLALNSEKQKKLRNELRLHGLKSPYLKACVKESMRLMSVTVGTRRLTSKTHHVLGYEIPPNIFVIIGHHLMSRMEKHYPRSMEFIPERWLVKEDDPLYYRNAHSFAYAPFGFGVRTCIAHRIATVMLEILTARMMESFQMEWSGPPPKVEKNFINYAPFHFIFKDVPE